MKNLEMIKKRLLISEILFCSLDKVKEKVLEYKQTRDPELFGLLLLRFDRFAVYLCHKFKRKYVFLNYAPLEDLYHTAIIAVHKSFISMPDTWKTELLLQRIKSYIKQEFYSWFNNKVSLRSDSFERCQWDYYEMKSARDLRNKISCYLLLDSLTETDRILIIKKIMEGWTYEELRQEYGGVSKQSLAKRVKKILKKIREVADK